MERHKINSELKKVIDTKMNTEDVEEDLSTLTVYQNKNGEGWVKVEIPCECSPRLKPSGFSAPNKDKA